MRGASSVSLCGTKCAIFEKRSTTTRMESYPSESGSLVIKSIDTSCHGLDGVSRGMITHTDVRVAVWQFGSLDKSDRSQGHLLGGVHQRSVLRHMSSFCENPGVQLVVCREFHERDGAEWEMIGDVDTERCFSCHNKVSVQHEAGMVFTILEEG